MKAVIGTVVTNFKNYAACKSDANFGRKFVSSEITRSLALGLSVAVTLTATLTSPGVASVQSSGTKTENGVPLRLSPVKKVAEGSTEGAVSSLAKEMANDITIYGVEMQEAFGRDFFTHFRLRPIGYSVTRDGFTEMLFRLPKSSQMRAMLNCFVVLDEEGTIIRARLQLKRRAIDDKTQGAYARDYAKSFIQAAVPEEQLSIGDAIGREIFYRQEITRVHVDDKSGSSTYLKVGSGKYELGDISIVGGGGEVPELPKKPSEFYQVFIGKEQNSEMRLGDVILRFSNAMLDGEDTLVISIARKGDPPDQSDQIDIDYSKLPMHIPML